MTQTLPTPRTITRTAGTAGKTTEQVQSMLLDIATVLRLTAKVKGEMLRDRAEADRVQLEANRAARAQVAFA